MKGAPEAGAPRCRAHARFITAKGRTSPRPINNIIPRAGNLSTLKFYIICLTVKTSKIWPVPHLHFSALRGTIKTEKHGGAKSNTEGAVRRMSEEFGGDFISITDEDGNEFELEHLDTIEYNGEVYMAFFPAVEGDEDGPEGDGELDDEQGLIILKVVKVDGEDQLSTLDDEAELEAVYQQFMETLFEDEED